MAKIEQQFSLSKSINFKFLLSLLKYHAEQILVKFDFKECNIQAMQKISVNASQNIFFSVISLQNVKEFDIRIEEQFPFNLQFEDLNIPYRNTKFSLTFFNSNQNVIQKLYSTYPGLFDVQFCSIHLRCYGSTQSSAPIYIENQFPQCPLEISLAHSFSLEQNYEFLNYLCKSQHFVKEIDYFEQNQYKLVDTLKTQKLELKYVNSIHFEQLSKFKITEEFEFMHFIDPEIIMSESKCECPPKIKVDYSIGKGKLNKQIIEILNGFCKYENVQEFSLKLQFEDDYNYTNLWRKLELFNNIKELNLSIPADAWTKDMLKLLASFKMLAKLQLEEMQSNQFVSNEIVVEISQYVIDSMKGVRKLQFQLQHAPVVDNLAYKHRPQPLTIIYEVSQRTQFIIDIRIGTKTLNMNYAEL